jgi:glycosyltransferase involved in cell wall biosynthesis
VILEAFQQRTPVIVRDLGGMPEYVEESGGGFIYDTDEELIAAMDWLLADRAQRDELGFRGYKAYSQKWTADAHLKCYLALIHHIGSASTLLRAHVTLAPDAEMVRGLLEKVPT